VLGGIAGDESDYSGHSDHIHHGAVCSGSFYTQVPPEPPPAEAGGGVRVVAPIIFHDPRGTSSPNRYGDGMIEGLADAPFYQSQLHFPRAGELVLFPPWLVHSVGHQHEQRRRQQQQQPGQQPGRERIAFSFNVVTAGSSLEAWSRTAV
jgi:hypothetical protein